MGSNKDFDLNHAIHEWQSPLRKSGVFTEDNLAELTDHLRDSFEGCSSQAASQEDCFRQVIQRVGPREGLIAEYYKSNRSILAKDYCLYFLMGAIGFLGWHLLMKVTYDIFCIIISNLGFAGSGLNIATWVAAIFVFSLFSVLSWMVFRSVNRPKKNEKGRQNLLAKRGWLIIVGFLGLFFLSSFPLFPFLTDRPTLYFDRAYHVPLILVFYGSSVWWMLLALMWATWVARRYEHLSPNRLLRNNRMINFAMGGLVPILFFIIINQGQWGFLHLQFLKLEVSQSAGNTILNSIMIGLILLPFALYWLSDQFPRTFLSDGHMGASTRSYHRIITINSAMLSLFALDLYSDYLVRNLPIWGELEFVRYQCHPVLIIVGIVVSLVFPYIMDIRRRGKRQNLVVEE